MILFIVILLTMTGCTSDMDHTIPDVRSRAQNFITKELESNDAPGIQYLVLNKDTTIFSSSEGRADISGQRNMDDSTTMMIYSMSKTFTAAAVLQLIEQGKISLDSPATNYLRDIPYGNQVTIRHLLSQTSGIPDPIPLKWVHLVEDHSAFDEENVLRSVLVENNKLDFPPGTKYAYSNISYWLLGRIIGKVSGMTYEEYVRQNIFRRLSLPASEIDFIIPFHRHHAKGYLPKWSWMNLFKSFIIESKFIGEYEDGWLHINDHYLNGPSFGGIVGTARSVGAFLQDQLRDSSHLFTKQTKHFFFEQQSNSFGEPITMTLGWHIGATAGVKYFFKEGGGGGFHCEMRIYPSNGTATVVIGNNTSFDAKGFLNIADKEFFLRK